jgi:hypothetical protein
MTPVSSEKAITNDFIRDRNSANTKLKSNISNSHDDNRIQIKP